MINEWGSKWPITPWQEPTKNIDRIGIDWPKAPLTGKEIFERQKEAGSIPWPKPTALDLAIGEQTVLTTFEGGEVKHRIINQKELKSQGSNLVDNQGYLYLQCDKCDKLLNPHTKSYLMLQDWRVSAGWKCIWNVNGVGYKVYCEGCKV